MSTNKTLPVQLMGASFATGALAAYVYSRYLQRVQQEATGSRGRFRGEASRSANVDPLTALFNQNDIGIHVLNRK